MDCLGNNEKLPTRSEGRTACGRRGSQRPWLPGPAGAATEHAGASAGCFWVLSVWKKPSYFRETHVDLGYLGVCRRLLSSLGEMLITRIPHRNHFQYSLHPAKSWPVWYPPNPRPPESWRSRLSLCPLDLSLSQPRAQASLCSQKLKVYLITKCNEECKLTD